ncbi:MAG: anti-sigma factor [Oceanicaulis sp.]
MSEDRTDEEGPDLLAAELALGVLEGEARAGALARMEEDPAFAAAVEAWSLRLAPLAEALAPVTPPAGLKARIETAVFGEPAGARSEPGGLWASLAFWRGAAAVFAATTLLAALLWLNADAPDPAPSEAYYAALQADPSAPSVLIRFDPDTNRLSIAGPLGAEAAEPVQPELWVIPPGGAPRSLGLIAGLDGALTEALEIDADTGRAIAQGATLAISLEPPGGSPTGAPTGPVVAAGAVRSL